MSLDEFEKIIDSGFFAGGSFINELVEIVSIKEGFCNRRIISISRSNFLRVVCKID